MTKILLVEDDQNLREIFEMRLQAEGYQTVVAGDGEEALVVAMKEKPDLIIADVMMPKLSGFEMLETLREAPGMQDTRVMMMTALGQAEDRARGEKLGVIKYLVKSQVTLEDFVRVVREVLHPNQADAAGLAASATDSAKADTLATNKKGSDTSMQEGTSPTNDDKSMPAPSGDSGGMSTDNPMGGSSAPTGGDMGSSGQMSTDEQKDKVDEQVSDWKADAPSTAPSTMPDDTPSAGDDSGTMPPTEPPAMPEPPAPGAPSAPSNP